MSKDLFSIIAFDLIIFVIIICFYHYPPKDPNYLIGYRTKRSMANDENWNFAQKYFARKWIWIPFIIVFIQLFIFLFFEINLSDEPPIIPLVSIIVFFVGSIFCAFLTEYKLENRNSKE